MQPEFDPERGLWVASHPDAVAAVLAHPACRVRPLGEPVLGSSAAGILSKLARRTEGEAHRLARAAIVQALATLDLDEVTAVTRRLAKERDGLALTQWVFDVPTRVVAELLGAPGTVVPATAAFVHCLSPLSTPVQLAAADLAADELMRDIGALMAAPTGLTAALCRHGLPRDVAVANLVGLLSQTHEATAGLIGNRIVAVLHGGTQAEGPVVNTRRFVSEDSTIAGVAMQAGATILVMLGESGFGQGRHACPGQQLATTIADAAMAHLEGRLDPAVLGWTYRASANARLPEFFIKETP
ncbi:MAG: cytochrome P450 [Pseudomonadota bacterium]